MRWLLLLLVFGSCCRHANYQEEAAPDYFLTVFVSAKNLDYANFYALCRSMQYSKSGNVGHAWIHLHGCENGVAYDLVGGLSGEVGTVKPRYCDGVMDYVECKDPNPVRYLWSSLNDGFFQEGSGGHKATCAVRFTLTAEQFCNVREFVESFDFQNYSLTGWQCASFAAAAASRAGIQLDTAVTVNIQPRIVFGGRKIQLWCDPKYSQISFPSPDALERSLRQLRK